MGTLKRGRRKAQGSSSARRWLPAGWGLSLAGLLAIAAGAWLITHTSMFDARSITVTGNEHLDRTAVLRQAGVGPTTNLVWFSPGDIEDRLKRSPWILSAKVTRALPSSLRITVTERSAIAVMGERAYLVAADGTILGLAESDTSLPLIDGPTGALRIGGRIPIPAPGLEVLEALPSSIQGDVKKVGRDQDGLLIVFFKDGSRAIYGDSSQAAAKGRAVQALLRYATKAHIQPERLDVRTPDHPALLPSGGEASPAA